MALGEPRVICVANNQQREAVTSQMETPVGREITRILIWVQNPEAKHLHIFCNSTKKII